MSHGEPQREPLASLRKVGPAWGCQVGMSCPSGASCRTSLFTGAGGRPPERGLWSGHWPAPAVARGHPGPCAQTPAPTLGGAAPSCRVTAGAGLGWMEPSGWSARDCGFRLGFPRHLRSFENRTGVSPDPPSLRVTLSSWRDGGAGGPAPPWRCLLCGPRGSAASAQVRARRVGRRTRHVLEGSPEAGLRSGPPERSETPRSCRRRPWG